MIKISLLTPNMEGDVNQDSFIIIKDKNYEDEKSRNKNYSRARREKCS